MHQFDELGHIVSGRVVVDFGDSQEITDWQNGRRTCHGDTVGADEVSFEVVGLKGDIVVVVIETRYIRPLMREMQGSKKINRDDHLGYDNLYIVTIPWFGKVKTLRLRYGAPYVPPPEPEA